MHCVTGYLSLFRCTLPYWDGVRRDRLDSKNLQKFLISSTRLANRVDPFQLYNLVWGMGGVLRHQGFLVCIGLQNVGLFYKSVCMWTCKGRQLLLQTVSIVFIVLH